MKHLAIMLALCLTFSACYGQLSRRQRNSYNKLDKIEQEDRKKKWPKPPEPAYIPNTLGTELNSQFKKHGDFCGFGRTNPDGDYIPSKGFLPRELLDQKVTKINIGGEYLLTYLFTKEQVDNFNSFNEIRGNRIIDLDRERFKINPTEGIPSAYISKSCSGYFNAQVSASGGFKAPIVALEAAVSAETKSDKQGTMVVVKGDFSSPLTNLIDTYNPDGLAINAFLWNHYINFPQHDKKLYYLNDFQGVHIRRFSEQKDQSSFNANLKFGLNGIVKLDASGEGGKEVRNLFKVKDWTTLITTDLSTEKSRDEYFRPINEADAIVKYFEKYSVKGEPNSDDPIMATGKKHRVSFTIKGLPPRLSNNYWSINEWDTNTYASEPILVESRYSADEKGCIIIIEGIPKTSIFDQRKTSVSPKFKFIGNSESKLGNKALTLKGTVIIPTSINPTLIVEDYSRPYRTEGNGSTQELVWYIDVKVNDENNPLDWNIRDVNIKPPHNFKIDGKQQADIENINFAVSCSLKSSKDKVYTIKIKTNNEFEPDDFDSNLKELNYQSQLVLELPLKEANGGIAEKPLNARISFPRVKSKPIKAVNPDKIIRNPNNEENEEDN